MRRRRALTVLAAVIAATSLSCGRDRVVAERVEVVVQLRSDRSLEVRETLSLPSAAEHAHFRRRVHPPQSDGVSFVSASLDGQPLERDQSGTGPIVVSDGRELIVELTRQPSTQATQVFGLTYVVHGAIAIRGARGMIRYPAIPVSRDYDVREATLTLAIPPEAHAFDGTGIAEAGWTVSRTESGIAAQRADMRADESATLVAEVSVDPSQLVDPSWQRQTETAEQLVPAFVSGGLFILVIGAGILWIIRFQYPKAGSKRRADTESSQSERQAVRAGLRTGGLVVLGFGVILSAVTFLTLSHLGVSAMCLPLSIVLVGLVFVLVAPVYV